MATFVEGFLPKDNSAPTGPDFASSFLPPTPPAGNSIARGVKQTGRELLGSAYGLAGLAADKLGAQSIKDYGLSHAQEQFQKSEDLSQPTDSLEGVHSVGEAASYLGHAAGYVGSQLAGGLGAGAIGSKLAQVATKKGIQGLTEAAAKTAVESAAKTGFITGMAGEAYGQTAGSMYPEMVQGGNDDSTRAVLFAAPAAAAGFLPELRILNKLFPGVSERAAVAALAGQPVEQSIIKNFALEGTKQASLQAVGGALQSVITRAAEYKNLNDDEAWGSYINSGALGAIGGGLLGGTVGAFVRGEPGASMLPKANAPIDTGARTSLRLPTETMPEAVPGQPQAFQYDKNRVGGTRSSFMTADDLTKALTPPAPTDLLAKSGLDMALPDTQKPLAYMTAVMKAGRGELLSPYEAALLKNPPTEPGPDYTQMAQSAADKFGYKLTPKRATVAIGAEQAYAEGRIDEPTYEQLHTLLSQSKLGRAASILLEETTKTKPPEVPAQPEVIQNAKPIESVPPTNIQDNSAQVARPPESSENQTGDNTQPAASTVPEEPGNAQVSQVPEAAKPAEANQPQAAQAPEADAERQTLTDRAAERYDDNHDAARGDPAFDQLAPEDRQQWTDLVANNAGSNENYEAFQKRLRHNAAVDARNAKNTEPPQAARKNTDEDFEESFVKKFTKKQNTADKVVADVVRRSGTADEVLKTIIDNTSDKLLKNFATRLRRYVGDTKISFADIEADAAHLKTPDLLERNSDGSPVYSGQYIHTDGSDGSLNGQIRLYKDNNLVRVVIHELVHAATMKAFNDGLPAARELSRLYNTASRRGNKALMDSYGMTNVDEFIAEAFSNKDFQNELANMRADYGPGIKNAWEDFKNIVKRIFASWGFELKTKNLLDQVLETGHQAIDEAAASKVTPDVKVNTARAVIDASDTFKDKALQAQLDKLSEPETLSLEKLADEKSRANDLLTRLDRLNTKETSATSAELSKRILETDDKLNEAKTVGRLDGLTTPVEKPWAVDQAEKLRVANNAAEALLRPQTARMLDTPQGKVKATLEALGNSPKFIDTIGVLRRGKMAVQFLRDLKDNYGHMLTDEEGKPLVDRYIDRAFAMGASANDILSSASKIAERWNNLHEKKLLSELAAQSTISTIHPDVPLDQRDHSGRTNGHLADKDGKFDPIIQGQHAQLQKMYSELTDKGRQVFKDARDFNNANWDRREELLNKRVHETYEPLIQEAMRLGNEDKAKDLIKEKNAFIAEYGKELARVKGPYFSLERFGKYFVVYKSEAYKAAEAKSEAASQALRELYIKHDITPSRRAEIATLNKHMGTKIPEVSPEAKAEIKEAKKSVNDANREVDALAGNGSHYANEAFESEAAATARAKELGTDVRLKEAYYKQLSPVTQAFLDRVADSMVGALPERQALAAREALKQIWLNSLPDTSAMRSEMRRRNVAGFSPDMLRAFSKNSQGDAHYLSRLEHIDDLTSNLFAMKDAKDRPGVPLQGKELYEEIAKRHVEGMGYTDNPIANAISGVSFVWQLGISPAFLLTNLSQPWMLSLPFMAARHGIGQSMAELGKGFNEVRKAITTAVKEQNTLFFSIDHTKFGDAESKMLDTASRNNLLDFTLEMDLSAMARGVQNNKVSQFNRIMSAAPHQVEVINRVMTALAAYRMEVKKGSSHDEATQYAMKVLDKTHIDYSNTNAPTLLKSSFLGGWGKVLFQYRKYQLGMMSLICNQVARAFEGNAEAKRAALGLFVMNGLGAGILGMPFVGSATFIANVVNKAFGDPDKSWDAENEFRNWLADTLGVDAGAVAAKGLPMLAGIDMSSRIGLGDVAKPVRVLHDNKQGRDLWLEMLASASGPTLGGLMPQMADGIHLMGQGDTAKGLEKMVPRALSSPMQAFRIANEGVTTSRGEVALKPEKITAWDTALEAMGVPPSEVSERSAAAAAIGNAKQDLKDRTKEISRAYVQARLAGDQDGMAEAQQMMRDYNEKRHELGEPVMTPQTLIQAFKTRLNDEKNMNEKGVAVSRRDKTLGNYGRFANVT